ncbi:MAG: TrkA domain protein [Candidatus Aldehydirespiratoraceae bacterium]|jgi:TrkA domain protein
MSGVRETKLPGVGVRHEFTAEDGTDVGVIVHHDGRREIVAYDADDPDACHSLMSISEDDTKTLAQILGVSPVTETVTAVRQVIEEMAIDWTQLSGNSSAVGTSIGSHEFRTRTGASIVAVIRDNVPVPSPTADFVLAANDVVVAVGPTDGLTTMHLMLGS